MPLPKKNPNEPTKKFVSRCMHVIAGENKPQAQKLAICYSLSRRGKSRKKKA